MSARAARLLVASDVATDAEVVVKLLAEEFNDISTSIDPDHAVEDFERCQPQVLVLAFNTLEKAERWYLGLYRLGTNIQSIPHRTVILCSKDELRRTYDLCRRRYFDDYVLFWPMTHDAPRLRMSVHHALRASGAEAVANVRDQARRIAELEARLAQYEAVGVRQTEAAKRTLQDAARDIEAAVDGLGARLDAGALRDAVEVRDRDGLRGELARLKAQGIAPPLRAVEEKMAPLAAWASGLRAAVAPQLEAARALGRLAERTPGAALVVDDDPFQHQLLEQMLAGSSIEPYFAASAAEAFAQVRKRRPDIVLMDVDLPDMNGIDAMRHLKAVEAFAGIPVIMVSGHSNQTLVLDAVRAGAVDYIVKPFAKAQLIAKLSKLISAGE